jgi:hypothetical protein
MKKKIVALGVLGALLVSTAVYAQNYTGDGGRGKSLAVSEPRGIGLQPADQTLTTLVQGYFATTLGTYSAINVQNRMNTEAILKEAELQNESSAQDIGKILEVDYLLVGTITRTSTAFALTIEITHVQDNRAMARHSGTYTRPQIEDRTAVNRATLDLLGGMGVTLTALARAELQQAASPQTIQGQTALARGIVAQRNGTEVTALSYYYQASVFDPSLLEAANRGSVMTANIASGNIGNDTRNDIAWRRDWLARLTETEQYFDNLFKSSTPPYGLFYLTALERGSVDYTRETTSLSFKVNLHAFSAWFKLVPAAVLQAVRNGLDATGRKNDWGLANWPRQTVTNLNPFQERRNDFAIIFELVNDKNEVIGRQSLNLRGAWSFSFSSANEVSVNYQENNLQTVTFSAVDANKITDTLTIRVAGVNGANPETVTRNGSLQITALSEFPPSDFELSKEGVLTRYTGSGGNLVIPAAIWGEPVKTIGGNVFEGKGLTVVTIPDGITSIGDRAFAKCQQLRSVTIPDSVTSIGGSAFEGCESLTSVTLPDGVTSIGINAFWHCRSLTGVTIPGSLTSIGNAAFAGCALTSVTIPGSVTSIGDLAFMGCALTSVTIPGSVTSIGKSAFWSCRSLTSVTIPNSVTKIGSGAFSDCRSLTSVIIPAGVTTIGKRAFLDCRSLTSVTIPGGVTYIGYSTFRDCPSLTSVTFGTGSNIAGNDFDHDMSFDGNLAEAYSTGKAGTYIRRRNTWRKQ